MKTSIYFTIVSVVCATLLFSCGPAATSAPAPTATTLPAATEHPAPTRAPTAILTVELTPTQSVPFPVTWTVRETTNADGRTIYVADDPAIVRAAQEGYEQLRNYYTFPNGLPLKEQIEKDAAEFTVDPDRARGMVEKIEGWRSYGGYWIYPPFEEGWKWSDMAEFTADGSQVTVTAKTVDILRSEWFDLQAGKVTYTQDSTNGKAVVTMLYDTLTDTWKLLDEQNDGNDGPVVAVTPGP